jgi:hypothetical protein
MQIDSRLSAPRQKMKRDVDACDNAHCEYKAEGQLRQFKAAEKS